MKKLIYLLFIFIFTTSSCHLTKKHAANKDQGSNETLSIEVKRTACFGRCPVYTIKIQGTGKVWYEGKANVEKMGRYEKQITQDEVNVLIKAFEDAKIWELQDEYTAKVTDFPTTYVSFSLNGKIKKIKDYYGAPQILKYLEKRIDDIANSGEWKKISEE